MKFKRFFSFLFVIIFSFYKLLQSCSSVFISKDVALLSVIVIVLQSSSLVFVWLCIVLRCWSLLPLLFDEPIREPLLSATGRPLFITHIHLEDVREK